MNISRIKNFVIVALVITAVYQTGMLWLDGYTGRNIFYYAYSRISDFGHSFNESVDVIDPGSIIIGLGDKKFYKTTDNIIKASADAFISDALENGQYEEADDITWETYLEGRSVVYEFPYVVSAAEYIKSYGSGSFGTFSNAPGFDSIALVPGASHDETSSVYFINSQLGEAIGFSISGSERGQELYDAIGGFQETSSANLYYLSSKQRDFGIFKDNIFIPQWNGDKYQYSVLECSKIFDTEEKTDEDKLQKGVEGFFSGFGSRQSSEAGGIYTFSSQDTVVKYYSNGILEYYNYDSSSSDEQSLATAYTVCQNFLETDSTMTQDLVLKNVELRDEGLVFYFDYNVNGIDIELSQEFKDSLGITSAVEVIVTNNVVKRYRKAAFDFTASDESGKINVDFSTALSDAMSRAALLGDITEIEDIKLGYDVQSQGKTFIKWYIGINGRSYITAAES